MVSPIFSLYFNLSSYIFIHIQSPLCGTKKRKQVNILLSFSSVSLLLSIALILRVSPTQLLHFTLFAQFFSLSNFLPSVPTPSLYHVITPPSPTLLFPISTQGLMNAWPPIDRDG